MKVFLIIDSKRHPCEPTPSYAEVKDPVCCPNCQATPLRAAGQGMHPSADDRAWEADGFCVECRQYVGTLRAEPNTLFGVREDRAVLEGRCRVY